MIGAIAGDIIGSVYEPSPIKTKEFPLFHPDCRFTDDSVLTIALAKAILDKSSYAAAALEFGLRYPHAGYGGTFSRWLLAQRQQPYDSWGNGAAMRASPFGFAFDSSERVLEEARKSAQFSHNHPEGIKGAQAAAYAVYLARTGADKPLIKQEIQTRFGYDLNRSLAQIRPHYSFDVSCQGTVPEAIIAFLESASYEDAVRNAVSLGGDSDTLACIAGGIAHAFYGGVPDAVALQVKTRLTPELWEIAETFCRTFGVAISSSSGQCDQGKG